MRGALPPSYGAASGRAPKPKNDARLDFWGGEMRKFAFPIKGERAPKGRNNYLRKKAPLRAAKRAHACSAAKNRQAPPSTTRTHQAAPNPAERHQTSPKLDQAPQSTAKRYQTPPDANERHQ